MLIQEKVAPSMVNTELEVYTSWIGLNMRDGFPVLLWPHNNTVGSLHFPPPPETFSAHNQAPAAASTSLSRVTWHSSEFGY